MSTWTLLHVPSGVEKTFEDWSFGALQIREVNQGISTATFTAGDVPADADLAIAHDDAVVLKKDGVRVFYGFVSRMQRAFGSSAEMVQFEVSNPWYQLENCIMQQSWKITNGITSALIPANKGRLVLNQAPDGTYIDLAAQIAEAVAWAVERGAHVALGAVPAGINPPYSEALDRTVAEVITSQLRWIPDAVVVWDYTTEPYPTINIVRRAAGTVVDVPFADGVLMGNGGLTPLPELKRPCVVLKFEATNTVDGNTWQTVHEDIYPPSATGLELRAAVATIELSGMNASYTKYHLEYDPIHPDNVDWWKKKVSSLAGDNVTDFVLAEGSSSVTPYFPRELISGSVPPLYDDPDRVNPNTVAKVLASYKVQNADGSVEIFKEVPLVVTLTGTDLNQNDYQFESSFTAGEARPTGLAQKLYEAVQELAWQGTLTFTGQEVDLSYCPGKLINLTGSREEWTTMRAQIQEVMHDVDSGTTTVTLGASKLLSATDLVELIRAARGRMVSRSYSCRATGQGGGSSQSKAGHQTANTNGSGLGGASSYKKLAAKFGSDTVFIEFDATGGSLEVNDGRVGEGSASRRIIIKTSDISNDDSLVCGNVKLQSLDVCHLGAPGRRIFLTSNPFPAS